MPELAFLPKFPPGLSQLTLFGGLLVLGLVAGEVFRRYLSLPRITGYAVAGVLLGPEVGGLLSRDALFDLRLLIDLSIGLVVFEIGYRLDADWLRRNRWLSAAALAESALCFGAIYATLAALGFRPILAATAAAIGTATSPAVVLLVSNELRSEGQVTERMLLFTAVNTVFAYVVLTLLLPFLHLEQRADWRMALLHPAYLFAGAVLAGYLANALLLQAARWVGKREEGQFMLLIAVIVLTIGLGHSLNLSVPLALLTLGMLARNRDRSHVLLPARLGSGAQLFFVILFVLTGASLEFHAFGTAAAGAVAAFIVARLLGKALAIAALGRASGISLRAAGCLAVSLVPMSGLAVVMVRDTVTFYPSFGRELAAVVLSVIVVLELAGPIATQWALRRAGEAKPDG